MIYKVKFHETQQFSILDHILILHPLFTYLSLSQINGYLRHATLPPPHSASLPLTTLLAIKTFPTFLYVLKHHNQYHQLQFTSENGLGNIVSAYSI